MKTFIRTPLKNGENSSGMAMFLVITFILLVFTLASIVALSLSRSFYQTENEAARVRGFSVAEAALNRAIFRTEVVLSETYGYSWDAMVAGELLPNKSPASLYTGQLDGIPYYYYYLDNDDGDFNPNVDSDGMIYVCAVATPPDKPRQAVRALIHKPKPPAALDYALFGNFVHFDNHNGAPFGVVLTTTVWSNSICKVDSAIEIDGQITAVNEVLLNNGPRGYKTPYCIVNPAPLQGDEGATLPVLTLTPPPDIKAFPNFDLALARSTAQAHGTYFASSSAFLTYLNAASRKTTIAPQTAGPPSTIRYIQVPNPNDLDQQFPLGDKNGNQILDGGDLVNAAIHTLTASNVNDLSYDNVYFVEGSLTLDYPINEMVRIEGSLVVSGGLTIHTAGEFLAYEERDSVDPATTLVDATPGDENRISVLDGNGDGTLDRLCDLDGDGSLFDFRNPNPTALGTKDVHYSDFPAVVAIQSLKIDKSDGGPTHIEGTVYTMAESHFHRSNVYEKAFVLGSEIADTVHNCEYISFLYDTEVKHTKGFAERLNGRINLEQLSFDENPEIPSWIAALIP